MTIGVAICCYKGHIFHLKRLFDSLEAQTRPPDQVVVSCSSSLPQDIPYLPEMYSFPLTFLTHPEKRNAAQNRNSAAAHLTTDIICFFDADDTMHPQRIHFIEECVMQHDAVIMLHNITAEEDAPFIEYGNAVWLRNILARCPWGSTILTVPLFQAHIANGHVSIRAEVFSRIRYDESEAAQGREDTLFCTNVIVAYPSRTAYCNYVLSKYYPSRTGGHA